MVNFWNLVNKVIKQANILLLVIDARMPQETRHKEIEDKILRFNKRLLYVINKCDLIPDDKYPALKKEFRPSVIVSSKDKLGGTKLLKKVLEISRGEEVQVGVLGYPNVGKSSVINLLKGNKAASVSSQSGHTRGIQFVKAKGKIHLIDTPGVLPYDEGDKLKQLMIGSLNPEKVREPEYFAMQLINLHKDVFEEYYDTKYRTDAFDFLEEAALNKNILKKGGEADIRRFSKQLLYSWQKGKIHKFKNELQGS